MGRSKTRRAAQSAAPPPATLAELKSPTTNTETILTAALQRFVRPGLRIGHRMIAPGDEEALTPLEWPGFDKAVPMVRRQSGAARTVARELLEAFGLHDASLPRSPSGAPLWPAGIIGSLAHDEEVALAVVADARRYCAVGVDVEPAIPLPSELSGSVATPAEQRRYPVDVIESRLLFALKEAVYKALHPVDSVFLDFHDIELDLDRNIARTTNDRSVTVDFVTSPRIVAIAFAPHQVIERVNAQ